MSDESDHGAGCVAVIGWIIDIIVVVVVMTMVCCGMTIGGQHYSFSCVSCEEGAIFEADDEPSTPNRPVDGTPGPSEDADGPGLSVDDAGRDGDS